MNPHVGGPADPMHAADGGCLFHGRTPADPRCPKPAVIHLKLHDPAYGIVSVATCAEHEPIARRAGEVQREHPHDAVCGMPGSMWLPPPENRCVLDVSGVEPARALLGEMTSA